MALSGGIAHCVAAEAPPSMRQLLRSRTARTHLPPLGCGLQSLAAARQVEQTSDPRPLEHSLVDSLARWVP